MVSKIDFHCEISQTLRNHRCPLNKHANCFMPGLEDVNSSQFFTRSNINNLCGHSLKPYKEHFRNVNEYSKFGSNFHNKCYESIIK